MLDVRFEPENDRSAAYDGAKNIGVCEFVRADGWCIVHTYTDPAYGGQGVAGRLVACVAEAAAAAGAPLTATCSYAQRWLEKRQETPRG